MTALDLSAYAQPEEHPDVTALKANVVRVMKKYTDRNGWCDEARQAMIEAGVINEGTNKRLVVNVTLKQGFECTPTVSVKDLLGKSEEAQKKALADTIGDITLRSSGLGSIGQLPVTADDIVSMSLPPAPEPGWRKATPLSRALHFFTAEALEQAALGRRTWAYPVCGTEGYSTVVAQEDVGTIRKHCVACERALARNA